MGEAGEQIVRDNVAVLKPQAVKLNMQSHGKQIIRRRGTRNLWTCKKTGYPGVGPPPRKNKHHIERSYLCLCFLISIYFCWSSACRYFRYPFMYPKPIIKTNMNPTGNDFVTPKETAKIRFFFIIICFWFWLSGPTALFFFLFWARLLEIR